MTSGEKLKRAREKRGNTQTEMSQMFGIAQPTYCQYETCAKVPNAALAVRMAQYLGTTCEEIFGEETMKGDAENGK